MTQYHILLRKELHKMPWDLFCSLLSALKEDTPLVQMVKLRIETDPEVMKDWTPEQKRINAEWQAEHRKELAQNTRVEDDDAMQQIIHLFGQIADNNEEEG